ncbi:MAG TPA: OmpA family protein [Polyangia bacterium]|nr:OmpA family protein [Polyangia bacterium]
MSTIDERRASTPDDTAPSVRSVERFQAKEEPRPLGLPHVRPSATNRREYPHGVESRHALRTPQLSEPIYFDVGKATIKLVSFGLLDEVVVTIDRHPQLEVVEVQVHSDERGNDEYNLRMSGERAAAVKTYLVGHGVAAGKLHNESCWSRNRRTELVIVRAR